MKKNRTNAAQKSRERVMSRAAGADAMLAATSRANDTNRSKGYFYGNMGDSIERRYGDDGFLGGGNDAFSGSSGPNSSWQAQGFGNYFGTGLLNGYGRMNSGTHGGGGGGFTYLRRFSSESAFNHQLISQCMLAYLGYGVVRNIIDLYSDFATEGISIDHPDESVRNFYKTWATKVDLRDRIHSMFLNLFVAGNVFVHRRWASLSPKEKRAMKSAQAVEKINDMLIIRGSSKDTTIEGRETGFIDWFLEQKEIHLSDDDKNNKTTAAKTPESPQDENMPKNPAKKIPWGYTFLNPLQMELRGRKLRGDHYWIMAIDKRDTLDFARGVGFHSSYNQELGTTEMNLPREFLDRIKRYSGAGAGYSAEVTLHQEELTVLQAPGKWDWFDWAVPFCYPALRALSFKDCLRNMEIKACQSVINSIFLFKLGDIEKGMPAEDEHFERLADMLQTPGQALNILWNESITAEAIQADIAGIFDTDKHDSADKDILTALGIPEVLIGGKGGNFSNSYIAVATVLERLESYRNKVHSWLMNELKIIADAMGFKKLPTVRFGRTSLKDEKAHQTFLMGLYDRGVLSADTLLEEGGTTAEIEASKMKEEKKKYKEKDIFEPKGPFVKDPKPAPGTKPPGGVSPKAKPKTPNGRPGGTPTGPTGKQSNPRGPKGQNVASLLETQEILLRRGRAMLNQLEDFISDKVLSAKARENSQIKHVKNLRAQERERLEWLIYNVFSHMPPPDQEEAKLKDDFIVNMLRSDACESVKADVFNIYTDKVVDYSKTFGKSPTREMRRQFMVSAWTQQAILQHVAEKPDILSI